MATNECIPFKEPGAHVTGHASAEVKGKRFVAIAGDLQADGSLTIAHANGTGTVGVSAHDAAQGRKVDVIRGPRMVVPVLAAANLAAGAEVAADAQGRAVAAGSNRAAGYLETAATSGQDARVCLY